MALAIRPKPVKRLQPPASDDELTLDASPYISGDDLWEDGVLLFSRWLGDTFGYGETFGDFEVAEKLDVHRVISDAWLAACVKLGYVEGLILHIGPVGTGNDNEAHASSVIMDPIPGTITVDVTANRLDDYDPWVDARFDADLPDALFPDMYVDRFYEVMSNEYYVVKRKARHRDNGHLFQTLDFKDHPRHANIAQSCAKGQRPPLKWREIIDQAASGEKAIRRRRMA